MAIYRNIQMSFWTDSKIIDDFSPDERYFYLYLMTNPHTNLAGCYEISMKHMADETGYSREKLDKLIAKLTNTHRVMIYSDKTKEVLLINWHKYNWTQSEKFRKLLSKEIDNVKDIDFKAFLQDLYNGIDTVSIPYPYGIDTTVSVSVTDTVTVSDPVSDSLTEKSKEMKEKKHKYGQYKHVLLSDNDIESLNKNHGEEETKAAIEYLDAYIEEKGYKTKNHKSTIERWVFNALKKNGHGDNRASTPFNATSYLLDQIREEEERRGKLETGKLITAITAAYPGYFRNSTATDINNLVNTWDMVMSDYTYKQASEGLRIFLASDTKGFPPSPGQVIDCIHKIITPEAAELSEGEAWHIVRKAIERGNYHAEEDFEKFPEIIKKAVGSASNLRSMAANEEYNEDVERSLFERAYRNILSREREYAKLPNNVKALIQNTVNQIEEKETRNE